MLTSRWPWLPVGPPCRRREIRGRQVVPVNNWLPCQLLTASFVPLRQAQGTKRRTHYRGLPSMAAGGKCRHSIFLCYAEDRSPCDKNGKPHMEWSCKNSRGRQEGRREKQRRAPFREKTSVFSVAGTHLPSPTLHAATVACNGFVFCLTHVRAGEFYASLIVKILLLC